MPNPSKTPHGTWLVRWRDPDGRHRGRSFKRKQDAARFLEQTRADLGRGVLPAPAGATKLTVAEAADEWLAGAMNLGAGGRETYRRDLDRYILPALGDQLLARLRPQEIEEFLAGELKKGLAPSSVHRHYRTIRRLCAVSLARGKIPTNPCEPVTPPRLDPAEMRFLDHDQVAALAAAISPRYRAFVLTACYAGLRFSELVGLRRQRVDLDSDRITVTEQLVRRADGQWHRDQPKTRAGRRAVALPAFLTAELAHHLEQWAGPDIDDIVFPNKAGAPIRSSNFTGMVFKPALERAGLDRGVRIHDLRHTAVALAIAAGAHPKAIQARMGHASIKVTLDSYGHLFPEMDTDLADALNRMAPPTAPLDDLRDDDEVELDELEEDIDADELDARFEDELILAELEEDELDEDGDL